MVHVLGGGLGLAILPSLYWSLSEPARHLKLGARMDEEGRGLQDGRSHEGEKEGGMGREEEIREGRGGER